MRNQIKVRWSEIRANYWLVPSLMAVAAIGLSLLTLYIDRSFQGPEQARIFWGGGPEAARSLMEVIATSMLTVATLTFSLTTVTLSQASSQFGPRLLRNFIRDTGNQFVLGTFVSTFVYCLLVLRAIRSSVEARADFSGVQAFVPEISITVGFVLALSSLGVLIYFIHHVSQSIYAPNVVAAVAEDMMEAIQRLFPDPEDPLALPAEAETAPTLPEHFEQAATRLEASTSGYLQSVDYYRLLELASRHNLLLMVTHRPGHFVVYGDDLALAWPPQAITSDIAQSLLAAFTTGKARIAPQDVEYAVDQLVEIALRALSAAINDPFTALNCIDWLGVGLSQLAQRKIPPPYFTGADGAIRIVLKHPVTFRGVVDAAFNQLRQHARNQVAVSIRLLETIALIAEHTDDPTEHAALHRQAQMIRANSRRYLEDSDDVADVDERFEQVKKAETE